MRALTSTSAEAISAMMFLHPTNLGTPIWSYLQVAVAIGADTFSWKVRFVRAKVHISASHVTMSDAALFSQLAEKWHEERGASSSITHLVLSPAYQKIIGMGERAVPLILDQLAREGDDPDHWGWALHAITGDDPVPAEAAGDTTEIARAWLAWGQWRNAW